MRNLLLLILTIFFETYSCDIEQPQYDIENKDNSSGIEIEVIDSETVIEDTVYIGIR